MALETLKQPTVNVFFFFLCIIHICALVVCVHCHLSKSLCHTCRSRMTIVFFSTPIIHPNIILIWSLHFHSYYYCTIFTLFSSYLHSKCYSFVVIAGLSFIFPYVFIYNRHTYLEYVILASNMSYLPCSCRIWSFGNMLSRVLFTTL